MLFDFPVPHGSESHGKGVSNSKGIACVRASVHRATASRVVIINRNFVPCFTGNVRHVDPPPSPSPFHLQPKKCEIGVGCGRVKTASVVRIVNETIAVENDCVTSRKLSEHVCSRDRQTEHGRLCE